MIVIAGPVFTQKWSQDAALAKIRDLYPVEFNRRLTLLDNSRHQGRDPSPLDFTGEGQEADFLWIDDSASAGARAWADFAGVYGFFSVRGVDRGVRVCSVAERRGRAKADLHGRTIRGAGQVFCLGSGEMWRLARKATPTSSGFTPSLSGMYRKGDCFAVVPSWLIAGRSRPLPAWSDGRCAGTAAQYAARTARRPAVTLELSVPDGSHQTLELLADATQAKGSYRGQFTARREGMYVLELTVPDTDNERLVRRVQVKVPELESENPRRNDALLSEIARKTGRHVLYRPGGGAVGRQGSAGSEAARGAIPRSEPREDGDFRADAALVERSGDGALVRSALPGMARAAAGEAGVAAKTSACVRACGGRWPTARRAFPSARPAW